MPTDRKIYLVSCVGKKRPSPSRARDIYVSAWFQLVKQYAEAAGSPWFILSAKYGLLEPDQIIEPYEQTLNTMPIEDRRAWADRVRDQLDGHLLDVRQVVFLAGARYREFLADQLKDRGIQVEIPMEGLTIGRQLHWLKNNAL
jgi:uncharacterized protein DUF6884